MESSPSDTGIVSTSELESPFVQGVSAAAPGDGLVESVQISLTRACQWLMRQQHAEGHWVAELEGDTILESETILLLAFFGEENTDLAQRLARYLLSHQLPEGGWGMYPGGNMDISGSVKAYFALKLVGLDPSTEPMQRARRAILAHGGADAVNSFTRFYLALLGQISYEHCPAVPPEVILLPRWFPVHLDAVSAWSRTIIVPLSIVSAMRPVWPIEPRKGIRELFVRSPEHWPPLRCPGLSGGTGLISWDRFFRFIDRAIKWMERCGMLPLRHRAVRAAERWMIERFKHSDGLGAIYPPIVWSLLALHCLGYRADSPEVRYCRQQLDDLMLEDPSTGAVRVQPCKSPVWDTAIALRALTAAGVPRDQAAIGRGVQWLLDRQITRPGDWAASVRAEPAGWCFEFNNDFYPDADDTAMVLMALREQFEGAKGSGVFFDQRTVTTASGWAEKDPQSFVEARQIASLVDRTATAIRKGEAWMRAMQNGDGGWGAFDRNNNRQFLCHVPFADHNAMIDPSTPDLTGRVLESLGKLGHRVGQPPVDRAVRYLRRVQEPDGSWFGRWGVNYVYGTWQALAGLAEVGVPNDDPMVVAGAQWLLTHQQPCGGWGESADTYADPTLRGQGTPTASQTAWALLGLLAAGWGRHPAVTRGVRFLLDRQTAEGIWEEQEFTGTGFPRVFYLRYHYYPVYFPLLALARWASSTRDGPSGTSC